MTEIEFSTARTIEGAPAPDPGPSGNEAPRQMLIEVLPPVLVIHLKCFLYDPVLGGMIKIGKRIQFNPEARNPTCLFLPTCGTDSDNSWFWWV